jgi:hypothetical protein
MGHYSVQFVGAVVYWAIHKFKKPFKECMNYKHAFLIGFVFIIIVFYLLLHIWVYFDG